MPIKQYGVLKGKVIDSKNGMGANPHFQIMIIDDNYRHRIAVNVKSKMKPSELLYYVDDDFSHQMLDKLESMPLGFHELHSKPGGTAMDYIRGNHFDTSKMRPLQHNIPGPDNDLNELIHRYISKAIAMENSEVYAFGAKWGPEENKRDKYFGFKPGNGIHDIHMNQGNSDKWKDDDGTWQDGGLLIHLPDESRWIGIFLAFQSQCFHTDDTTGHAIPNKCGRAPEEEEAVKIIAALVNPKGHDPGYESIILLNPTPDPINLEGWAIADKNKKKYYLQETIKAGETMRITLSGKNTQLSNKGGIISLLNKEGLKVDGVSYTKEDARSGWMVVF
ncbi:DUF2278 family protein [Methanolobus sp. ZRKC3]|uniref:DUF2278 family protein n=1 Tax=Methanolobus sp. ZRKC3 TaxID=3125786 RepID=UPI003254D3EE